MDTPTQNTVLPGSSQQTALLLARPELSFPLLTQLSVTNCLPSTLNISQLAVNLSAVPAVIADIAINTDNSLTASVSQQAVTPIGVGLTSMLSSEPSVINNLIRYSPCSDSFSKKFSTRIAKHV